MFICYLDFVIHMTGHLTLLGRKRNNHNYLIQLQPLQHGENQSVVTKKISEKFKKHFSLEGAVFSRWEYCMNELFHDGGRYHIETGPFYMQSKSMDWFLYDNGSCHERFKTKSKLVFIVWRKIYMRCQRCI